MSSSPRAPRAIALRRRGVFYGSYAAPPRRAADLAGAPARWSAARPILLPRWIALAPWRDEIRSTLALFERVRAGSSDALARHVRSRVAPKKESRSRAGGKESRPRFVLLGASVDLADAREIEKVHADAFAGARAAARDLYAKLSWVSTDPRDRSLRVRVSFGSERDRDWMRDARRAVWADRFAERAFPACGAITKNSRLVRRIERLVRRRVRFSERIVYANAPGGGAVFHHDAEARQLGVVYAQLAGSTAWLVLPKRELAAELGAMLRRAPARVLRALDRGGDRRLERALNGSPELVARLVARGAFHVLHAGDAILLPSIGPDDVAWHSVFGIGGAPGLSLSFAIFRR